MTDIIESQYGLLDVSASIDEIVAAHDCSFADSLDAPRADRGEDENEIVIS